MSSDQLINWRLASDFITIYAAVLAIGDAERLVFHFIGFRLGAVGDYLYYTYGYHRRSGLVGFLLTWRTLYT